MARSIWTGAISVGMLNVPVKLTSAVRRQSISFNQIDDRTGSRIRYQKVAEANDEVVEPAHIVKAVDLGGERYLIIDDADLAPLAPAKSKEIGIDTFVPDDQISPTMFESSYIVLPGKVAKPYALLARALAGTGHVGIGKFVMRQKEYLVALRSDGEHLTLSTLAFPDEIVDPATVDDLDVVTGIELSDRELKMAASLVEALSDPFEPAAYRDEYREAVMAVIEAKAAGHTIEPETAPARAVVVDLAEALEASVEAAKASRSRHPTARAAGQAAQADKASKARPKKTA